MILQVPNIHMLAAVIAAFNCCLCTWADTVELRDGRPSISGEVTRLDDAGVRIRLASGTDEFIPWDRVRDLQTSRAEPQLAARLKTAELLWRARTRLQRHDTRLAEPLFERLFVQFKGQTHETALLAAEGLLRCRLARFAQDTAVIPALESARIRRAGIVSESFANLPEVIHAQTSLCTQLPPAWDSNAAGALVKLERDLASYEATGDAVAMAMAWQYRHAVRMHLGMQPLQGNASMPDHPGVQLLAMCVALNSQESTARATAREHLQRHLEQLPDWAKAWMYYGIGVHELEAAREALQNQASAKTQADALQQQRQALVKLVYVPAKFSATSPYLAGLAISRLANVMDQQGDAEAAAALRRDLQRSFPNHPSNTLEQSTKGQRANVLIRQWEMGTGQWERAHAIAYSLLPISSVEPFHLCVFFSSPLVQELSSP